MGAPGCLEIDYFQTFRYSTAGYIDGTRDKLKTFKPGFSDLLNIESLQLSFIQTRMNYCL